MKKFIAIVLVALLIMSMTIVAFADEQYSYLDEVKANIYNGLKEEEIGFEILFKTEYSETDDNSIIVHLTIDDESKEAFRKNFIYIMKHDGYTIDEINDMLESEDYNYIDTLEMDMTLYIHNDKCVAYGKVTEDGITYNQTEVYDNYMDIF